MSVIPHYCVSNNSKSFHFLIMLNLCHLRCLYRRSKSLWIALLCLILIFIYYNAPVSQNSAPTTVKLPVSRPESTKSVIPCSSLYHDNYIFLDIIIENQPELIKFIQGMASVPLILIDGNILEALLSRNLMYRNYIYTQDGEFFQFALRQEDWQCLIGSIPVRF